MYDLEGLAEYLAKATDGRARLKKRDENLTRAELKCQKAAAAKD